MMRHLAGGLCVAVVLAAGCVGQVQADERTQKIADLQRDIRRLDEQVDTMRWRQEQYRIVTTRAREIRDSVKMPDGSSMWSRLEYLQNEDRRLERLGYSALESTRQGLRAELRSLLERYKATMDERIRTDDVMRARAISSYDELLAQYGSRGTKRLTDGEMAKFNDLVNERRRLEAELERLHAAVVAPDREGSASVGPRPEVVYYVIRVEGSGFVRDSADTTYVVSGSHEERFELRRGQDLQAELEAYHTRLARSPCDVGGVMTGDRRPEIWNAGPQISEVEGPILDRRELDRRPLGDTWRRQGGKGPDLAALRKAAGCAR